MKVLIACEESQTVCKAFREKGHEAYSCDILPCSGGHPEWHYQQDVFEVIGLGWDMMIAHPPCTHLTVSGARWFKNKIIDGRQRSGIDFFMKIINSDVPKIAVENPVGIMSTIYRKPDQIIQPYYFGDSCMKTTCLWLKNIPLLFHAKDKDLFNDNITHVYKGDFKIFDSGRRMSEWYYKNWGNASELSKTFPGIAQAMADQWG